MAHEANVEERVRAHQVFPLDLVGGEMSV